MFPDAVPAPDLLHAQACLIDALSMSLQMRDPYTRFHCDRVGTMCEQLGRYCDLDATDLSHLALAARFPFADVGRGQRAIFGNALQDGIELRFIPIADPAPPIGMQAVGIAGETVFPIRKSFNRQDRRVVGPVFEYCAVAFMQLLQCLGAVGLAAAPQDHVMRPGDGVDAVDLDKADAVDQRGKVGT